MDILRILRKRCQGRVQHEVAAELGVSPQYLSDVLNGRKEAGDGILKPLGYERVVKHRRIKEPNGNQTSRPAA